ncbi:MAG: ribbon-helix-helix domain-containing protein [Desulfobacterales bacterium]|nr:ribbon-helix-helix domain-containing protein [Desulfobacterales bacterium]
MDKEFIGELDGLVKRHVYQSRSQVIQEAVSEKLLRLKRSRLAIECAKLDRVAEKAMAEEGLSEDVAEWPEY